MISGTFWRWLPSKLNTDRGSVAWLGLWVRISGNTKLFHELTRSNTPTAAIAGHDDAVEEVRGDPAAEHGPVIGPGDALGGEPRVRREVDAGGLQAGHDHVVDRRPDHYQPHEREQPRGALAEEAARRGYRLR